MSSPNAKGPLAGAVAMISVTLLASPCAAQSRLRLDSDARLILSDNPFLLSGTRRGTAAVEVVARPELNLPLAPTTALDLSAVVAHRQYLRRYGNYLTGRAEAVASHRDSEYLSFDTRVSYARELPADALTDSIDFSVDSRSLRESVSTRSSLSWNPNARTQVTAAGGWERSRYPDSALLSSTEALRFDLGMSRRISATTALGVQANATISEGAGSDDLNAKSLRATIAQRIGTYWQANAQLGLEWTNAGSSDRPLPSGSGNFCYTPASFQACLSASLQSEVSGFGGLQREYYIGATANWRLSERSSVSATASYRAAQSGTLDGNANAMRLSGSYERRLTRALALTGSLDYLARKTLTGERHGAMVFQIGITFRGERP